jgi:putative Mg2+ transporter-C (MgtC) family protein
MRRLKARLGDWRLGDSFSFEWHQALIDFIRVAVAFSLALPIGWERIQETGRIGLRTFPIVAMASCGFMLVIRSVPGVNVEAEARVIQGVLTGIGFIGGGAILKGGMDVRGLASAASIWNTGAIGVAVAFGREEIAVVLSLINFLALYFLTPLTWRERQREAANTVEADREADTPQS